MKGMHFHRHTLLCVHCVCNLLNTNNFVTQYRVNKEKNVPVAFSFPLETIEISMVGKSHTEPKLYFRFIFPTLLIQWDTKVLNAMKRSRGLTPSLSSILLSFCIKGRKTFLDDVWLQTITLVHDNLPLLPVSIWKLQINICGKINHGQVEVLIFWIIAPNR